MIYHYCNLRNIDRLYFEIIHVLLKHLNQALIVRYTGFGAVGKEGKSQ